MLALAGAWSLLVRRRVDRLVLGIAAWMIACALFLGWSIVRTVEPRYVQDAWEFIGRVELATSPPRPFSRPAAPRGLWRLGFVTRVASVALVAAAMRIAAGALAAWIF